MIQLQRFSGGSACCRYPDDLRALPTEVPVPSLGAWVKKSNRSSGLGIDASDVIRLETVAGSATHPKVFANCLSPVGERSDVFGFQSDVNNELRSEAVATTVSGIGRDLTPQPLGHALTHQSASIFSGNVPWRSFQAPSAIAFIIVEVWTMRISRSSSACSSVESLRSHCAS